jgi:hypothetical protein
MTEHHPVVENDGAAQLLEGDCGVVVRVVEACPDAATRRSSLRLGAEIYTRTTVDT